MDVKQKERQTEQAVFAQGREREWQASLNNLDSAFPGEQYENDRSTQLYLRETRQVKYTEKHQKLHSRLTFMTLTVWKPLSE